MHNWAQIIAHLIIFYQLICSLIGYTPVNTFTIHSNVNFVVLTDGNEYPQTFVGLHGMHEFIELQVCCKKRDSKIYQQRLDFEIFGVIATYPNFST